MPVKPPKYTGQDYQARDVVDVQTDREIFLEPLIHAEIDSSTYHRKFPTSKTSTTIIQKPGKIFDVGIIARQSVTASLPLPWFEFPKPKLDGTFRRQRYKADEAT
ncbi:hypothetical protein NECAME_09193 [Necator americanus]|uniref:Uncharacterized protein n=1 Tax=Necator americanus TaxID=51031 RepID=W2TF05_NECAM|nr:hypothetical protein NECAME_09193 [Necator americanus]ETN80403.1 hypothetical protein NECAME_09193 [Necator americanus]